MQIDFNKGQGLIPAIIQDYRTKQVLMLGYMNADAFKKTIQDKYITFFSRQKQRLWTKGETSGNFLEWIDYQLDCDKDTLLFHVKPMGPTCHTGNTSCFLTKESTGFIYQLEETMNKRINSDDLHSYTNQLFQSGINKIAQKVGEEAVELIIESKDDNDQLFKNEAADLMYHFLLLLKAKGTNFEAIESVLKSRSK